MARVWDATKNPNDINSVSQFQPRKKAAKGTVVVQVFKERLRLCWSYLGKRYYLYSITVVDLGLRAFSVVMESSHSLMHSAPVRPVQDEFK